jgi:hypothetical protein
LIICKKNGAGISRSSGERFHHSYGGAMWRFGRFGLRGGAAAAAILFALAPLEASATSGANNTYTYDALGRLIKVVIGNSGDSDAPTAVADSVTTDVGVALTYDPRANDTDPAGEYLTITAVGTPAHGTVAIGPGGTSLTYTPAAGFTGTDSFSYTVSNGQKSATATDTVTVVTGPVANPDSFYSRPGVALTYDPRTNDTGCTGCNLKISGVTQGSHGWVAIKSGGTQLSYTAANNFFGTDTFTYTISDGVGGASTGTETATVSNPPNAVNDSITVASGQSLTYDPRANDSDPQNYSLTITATSTPSHGSVAIGPGGTSLTYTAYSYLGSDSFTYTISNGHGQSATATDSVSLVPYQAPTAVADNLSATAVYPGGGNCVTPGGTIDPRTNDISPLGYPLTVTAVTQGASGSVTYDGGSVTYEYGTAKCSQNFNASDSFTYTISDGHGGTSTTTVSVSISVSGTQ